MTRNFVWLLDKLSCKLGISLTRCNYWSSGPCSSAENAKAHYDSNNNPIFQGTRHKISESERLTTSMNYVTYRKLKRRDDRFYFGNPKYWILRPWYITVILAANYLTIVETVFIGFYLTIFLFVWMLLWPTTCQKSRIHSFRERKSSSIMHG